MSWLDVVPGSRVMFRDTVCQVQSLDGLDHVVLVSPAWTRNEYTHVTNLKALPALIQAEQLDLFLIEDKDWNEARRRLAIIEPLLKLGHRSKDAVQSRASVVGTSVSSIYRWLKSYDVGQSLAALIPRHHQQRGQHRIEANSESILTQTIDDVHLKGGHPDAQVCITETTRRCRLAGAKPPSATTIRHRLQEIDPTLLNTRRSRRKYVQDNLTPRPGLFTDAQWPLQVVMADHSWVDLDIVDDHERLSIGRPTITFIIDAYSRVITGFYISLEKPSATVVGLCIAMSVAPKERYLQDLGAKGRWPIWGKPTTLHVDNGKEFHSKALAMACEKHHIHINYRPVRVPHYGGYIERLFRTASQKAHGLPGNRDSNVSKLGEYNSAKHAALTLREFERWTAEWVTWYNQTVHTTIKVSPLERWTEGIYSAKDGFGIGQFPRLTEEGQQEFFIDFLPAFERTIQKTGVQIDDIEYYGDALRPYINSASRTSSRKFFLRRDPRDISSIYFYSPREKVYHRIPYRDISQPAITAWELRQAKELLRNTERNPVTVRELFETVERMRTIEGEAIEKTSSAKARRRRARRQATIASRKAVQAKPDPVQIVEPSSAELEDDVVRPFPDLRPSS